MSQWVFTQIKDANECHAAAIAHVRATARTAAATYLVQSAIRYAQPEEFGPRANYTEMVSLVGAYLQRLHDDGYEVLQGLAQWPVAPQHNAYVTVRLPDVVNNIALLKAADVVATPEVGESAKPEEQPRLDSVALVSRELQAIAHAMSQPTTTPKAAAALRARRDRALKQFDLLVIQKGEETWDRDDIDEALSRIDAAEVPVS